MGLYDDPVADAVARVKADTAAHDAREARREAGEPLNADDLAHLVSVIRFRAGYSA